MKAFAIFIAWITLWNAGAATYYIDYASGSDSNAGTSTSTPWKRSPYMNGFSGSYSHTAGDAFIFKGGVTWSNAAFPMLVSGSGTAGNYDQHGTSPGYFSGAEWTRPIFDLQYTSISTNSAIFITGSFVTISGIEIAHLKIPNSGSWNAFGVAAIQGYDGTSNITVQGCHIHNWRAGTATNDINNTDSDFGGIYFGGTRGSVLQNVIGPGEAPAGMVGNSGCGVAGGAILIQSNTFIGCTEMINAGATNISFNTFRNGTNSYDPQNHANAIYHGGLGTNGRAYIYNNVFHDLDTTFQTMLLHPGTSGATNAAYYLFNNVIWNVSSPVDVDESGIIAANSGTWAYLFNNTIQNDITVAAVKRSQTFHLTGIECRNNHWISDTETPNPIGTSTSTSAYASVGTLVDTNNLWQSASEAAGDGYVIGNAWSPTSETSPTIGVGSNLSSSNLFAADFSSVARPSTGSWDIGAYQFAEQEAAPAATIPTHLRMRVR